MSKRAGRSVGILTSPMARNAVRMLRRFRPRRASEWLVLAAGALLLWNVLAAQREERAHWLSRVPGELQVTEILYVRAEAWGFGLPGDNETGVVLYELPAAVAESLQREGPALLAPSREWRPTPVAGHKAWFEREGAAPRPESQRPQLANYLDQYGFGIPIDAAVAAMIDKAIAEPGSAYAYTRGGGVLLIMPAVRRVAFIHAG